MKKKLMLVVLFFVTAPFVVSGQTYPIFIEDKTQKFNSVSFSPLQKEGGKIYSIITLKIKKEITILKIEIGEIDEVDESITAEQLAEFSQKPNKVYYLSVIEKEGGEPNLYLALNQGPTSLIFPLVPQRP